MNEVQGESVSEHSVFEILINLGYKFFSVPKCMFTMRLKQFDPLMPQEVVGNDFLAVPEENYEAVAQIVNASI